MMGRWAFLSAMLHTLLITLGVVGLLDYKTDFIEFTPPIPIDLVTPIEEIAKSPEPIAEPEPTPIETKEAVKKPPSVDLPSPPTPEPTPDVIPEPTPEPPLETPSKDILPPPAIKPDTPPQPDLFPIEPPKRKPTPPAQKKKKPKKKAKKKTRDFDSILKNLTNKTPVKKKTPGGTLSDHLAASELDKVRKQIETVWDIPSGTKDVHLLSIKVNIIMNPDRTVRSARLIQNKWSTHPTYQILAESALKTLNKFKYTPLLFPPHKYKIWKEIHMTLRAENAV